jgi:hypothetical protein
VPPHPLDSAFHRVCRAGKHLADLGPQIVAFKRKQEDGVLTDLQSDGRWNDGILTNARKSTSAHIAVLVGEICYNLRTSLEYLVFELAKLDAGSAQDRTQFPIEDTRERFQARKRQGWLKDLNPGHVTAIERLQPYNGCEWARLLRDASNRDKHRELVFLVGMTAFYIDREITIPNLTRTVSRTIDTATGEEVDVNVDFDTTVSFEDGSPVMETLEEIKLGVAETLAAFKPEFERC